MFKNILKIDYLKERSHRDQAIASVGKTIALFSVKPLRVQRHLQSVSGVTEVWNFCSISAETRTPTQQHFSAAMNAISVERCHQMEDKVVGEFINDCIETGDKGDQIERLGGEQYQLIRTCWQTDQNQAEQHHPIETVRLEDVQQYHGMQSGKTIEGDVALISSIWTITAF